MRLNDLHPPEGSRHESRRLGRGNASGQGTTAGKGTKGQKARSGGAKAAYRGMSSRAQRFGKLPGFNNKWRIEFSTVKLSDLEGFEAHAVVDPAALRAAGLIRGKAQRPVKLLGGGEISKPLVIRVERVTASTRVKIEAAGGRVEDPTDGSSST
jgi:large subunit ribosomal protein L15